MNTREIVVVIHRLLERANARQLHLILRIIRTILQ